MRPVLDSGWFRFILVLAAVFTLQLTLVPSTQIDSVKSDLMVLLVIATASRVGPEAGAVYGFATGLMYDFALSTPFGLSALTYTLVGRLVGDVARRMLRAAWWVPYLIVVVGSFASAMLYAALGQFFELETPPWSRVLVISGVVAGVNLIIAPVAIAVTRWVFANLDRRQAL
jgi:rod shape-determining protein MreD